MKQVLQSYQTGELRLADVPLPALAEATLLVKTANSLISVGTERSMIDVARKSLMGKALARPDLVRQVIGKVRSEGIAEAYRQAAGRLDAPVPLGYSASGVVQAVGNGVGGFVVGDRVACAGSGIASHAEVLRVPRTLAVRIPDDVSLEAAAFVALGGIAMHAVRLARLEFGERAVVLGLGLLGQLAVQILSSAGCRVLGVDVVAAKVAMAVDHGAECGAIMGNEDVVGAVQRFSDGHGADAVLIFASTDSNDPLDLAAEVCRERGRLVVPGLVGLDVPRKPFYEKELDLVVSRAWGAGMYDPEYEAGAIDYPLPYVRWTAQRNMGHFLDLLSRRRVAVERLITHRFPIDEAVRAYQMILGGREPVIGVVLNYPERADMVRTVRLRGESPVPLPQGGSVQPMAELSSSDLGAGGLSMVTKNMAPLQLVRVGLIGAGQFARGTLLPALTGVEGVVLRGIATTTGVSGEHLARKYGLAYCTTDVEVVLQDSEIDLVLILTRHGSHASLVSRALAAGKHVFVEKPLALNEEQLQQVVDAYRQSPGQLMVGLNRRFAPTAVFAVDRLKRVPRPIVVAVRANVGHMARGLWVHDLGEGGGNLVGEVCHYIDLVQVLTGSMPVRVYAQAVAAQDEGVVTEDNVALTLEMADGSLATVLYSALGDKAYERERVEVLGGGAICVLSNFRTVKWTQAGSKAGLGGIFSGVDRGHRAEMGALIGALRDGRAFPVSLESYVATSRATFAAVESLRRRCSVKVNGSGSPAAAFAEE